jgi:glycoside/pentoside/hexuronide:cation symporter, GPH family
MMDGGSGSLRRAAGDDVPVPGPGIDGGGDAHLRAAGEAGSRGAVPALRLPDLARYGALRGPLALLELPLFVLLPAFYGDRLGMDLTLVGAILFLTRLIDAVIDPAIGSTLDSRRDRSHYRRWILWSLPVLAIGYAALFNPPQGVPLPAWLALTSMVTYLAYSVVSIAYQAWGAALGRDPVERVRITATREAFGLVGVVVCASLLVPERVDWLVGLFVLGAALAALALWHAPLPALRPATAAEPAPAALARTAAPRGHAAALLAAWRDVMGCRGFRWMLATFVLNGIATAIPATLVLFFIADVLRVPEQAPMFLVAYFLAAALGMPAWVRLARRFGLRSAWLFGMALAVFAFVWTLGLGVGDSRAFLAVCIVTGFALGADLALPPALLANVLAAEDPARRREGTFFGVWNLATKLNLALAAGLALPILDWLGYVPGGAAPPGALLSGLPGGSSFALSVTYAALPSALKLAAGFVLILAPLQADDRPPEK